MKYALVNGERREAEPDLSGECPIYGHPMIAKCGEKKMRHWSHRANSECDHWWENETEWHRAWKDHFPVEWQEFIHTAGDGEKHIADVRTDQNWVLEFQHSYLNPEERRDRDAFYPKLVWIIDGTRRKKDLKQLSNAWVKGHLVNGQSFLRKIDTYKCTLLREWADTNAPVFFDFGLANICWLLPKTSDGKREYVAIFPRTEFIKLHLSGAGAEIDNFATFLKEFSGLADKYNSYLRARGLH